MVSVLGKERPQVQVTNLQKTVGSSIELPITVSNFKTVVNEAKAVPVSDAQGRVMSMYSCVICSKYLQVGAPGFKNHKSTGCLG